jgi:hypothetical protein
MMQLLVGLLRFNIYKMTFICIEQKRSYEKLNRKVLFKIRRHKRKLNCLHALDGNCFTFSEKKTKKENFQYFPNVKRKLNTIPGHRREGDFLL